MAEADEQGGETGEGAEVPPMQRKTKYQLGIHPMLQKGL